MNYHAAKAFIVDKLNRELSPKLTYHGLHHTFDVLEVTDQLCQSERISVYESMLLKTAVLFHDSGFIQAAMEHEARGCDLARKVLPKYDYTDEEIERICGMIMATRIPQSPKNKLEEIICDADLDYLGRDDFYSISATLFEELKFFGILETEEEWNRIQLKFIGKHSYFTSTNQRRRAPKERLYLEEIESIVAAY
ncbi:MAG: phosphohydrolase [Saprospiraceae bacterium]|nr:phosphohydrolase [Saprospiraceae bacterium]MCB9326672.1 phosphohydrolase [Lewinellaceae bacterium]